MLQKSLLYIPFFAFLIHFSEAQNLEVKTYYDNEKKLIKEIYNIDKNFPEYLNGPYESFFPSGQQQIIGYYRNNEASDIWTYFYFNGNPKMKGAMVGNEPSGPWIYYFENGKKSMEGTIENGNRVGEWTFFYENGNKKSEGEFSNGKKTGSWKYYYEDETLKAEANYIGNKAQYHEFYSTGNIKAIGFKEDEKSDSLWSYFYENGVKMGEGSFKEGRRSGKWTYYHQSGKISSEGMYEGGRKNGYWKYYDENATLSSEGIVLNDKKEGYWKLYYGGGELKGEGEFDKGTGRYKEYYESGILKKTGIVKDDIKQGKWLFYYESGELEGEVFFDKGKGEFIGYYPSGEIKMKGRIEDDKRVGTWVLYDPEGKIAGYYNTVYNDDNFRFDDLYTATLENNSDTINYEKPAYTFKNKKSRYFESRLNEFKGIIFSANPLAMAFGDLPVSAEYYMQERLGYELQFTLVRSPFFSGDASVRINEIYERGFSVAFKQKFYQIDKAFGMLYLSHEIRFTDTDYKVNTVIQNNTAFSEILTIKESGQKYEYSVVLGNRITRDAGDPGFTLDVFMGLGVGFRNFNNQNYNAQNYWMKERFSKVDKSKITIPIRVGLNIGYIF